MAHANTHAARPGDVLSCGAPAVRAADGSLTCAASLVECGCSSAPSRCDACAEYFRTHPDAL